MNNNLNAIEQEISIDQLLRFVKRNTKAIAFSLVFGFFIASFGIFTRKPTWQGNFKIVVKTDKESGSSDQIKGFRDIFNPKTNIKNEIEILKTPYVLFPIFEYVKNQKFGNNAPNNFTFEKWVKNYLSIELLNETNVLGVFYKENNKEEIVKVLEKISEAYQNYSVDEKKRRLETELSFLKINASKLRQEYNNSLRKIQNFSLKNGFGDQDGLPLITQGQFSIENDINSLTSLESGGQDFIQESSTENIRYKKLFDKLIELEAQLATKESKLKPSSQLIKNLKNSIENTKEKISRPKEVIIEYKNLESIYKRNKTALDNLERSLLAVTLQLNRPLEPWLQITEPFLKQKPIDSSKSLIYLIAFFSSFLIGLSLAYFSNARSGILYEYDKFNNYLPYFLIKRFYLKNSLKDLAFLLTKSKNLGLQNGEVEFLNFSQNSRFVCEDLKILLKNEGININVINKIEEANIKIKQIIFITPGTISSKELIGYINDIDILDLNIIGWIYLDNS